MVRAVAAPTGQISLPCERVTWSDPEQNAPLLLLLLLLLLRNPVLGFASLCLAVASTLCVALRFFYLA